MSEIDEHLFEIYTRLSFYEFPLEVFHANLFRNMPNSEAELDHFGENLLDRIQHGSTPNGVMNSHVLLPTG
ncbi:MAG: hypothetical protein M3410_08175 [Acidobacteriota bacterium]|nr:hypothetical protein [Acidobacteriota bacterium]